MVILNCSPEIAKTMATKWISETENGPATLTELILRCYKSLDLVLLFTFERLFLFFAIHHLNPKESSQLFSFVGQRLKRSNFD